MATHSSSLAWEIPWTEEPGGIHKYTLFVSIKKKKKERKHDV